MWLLFTLVCMIVCLFLFTVILYSYNDEYELITCIMITGGFSDRKKFIQLSIDNFREQTYKNKHLVILNHGDTLDHNLATMFNVTEINTTKATQTLGDLRNMAFEYVPFNGLFCVWDDDDYRSPSFLKVLYTSMKRNGASAACFTNRLEYNMNTNFAWETYWESGFVHVLAKKHYKIRYDSLDSMEDVHLLERMRDVYNVHTMSRNDPRLYVRLIHATNTSLYVDRGKTTLVGGQYPYWHENILAPKYKRYIDDVYLPKLL